MKKRKMSRKKMRTRTIWMSLKSVFFFFFVMFYFRKLLFFFLNISFSVFLSLPLCLYVCLSAKTITVGMTLPWKTPSIELPIYVLGKSREIVSKGRPTKLPSVQGNEQLRFSVFLFLYK